ncbi:MAG TPA: radical SAM protein [Bacteroidota bacterium]|nr:radical SAM protein [Bacteroidota bacterium]
MAEILFTHSYFLALDPKEHRAMMPYAPLGTLYAASQVRTRGHTVALFDSMLASGAESIASSLDRHKPAIVAIYDDDFNYLTKMCLTRMRDAAFAMTRLAKQRGCVVVVHGSDPADHALEYLGHGADYVIAGEGELTLAELIEHITSGLSDDALSIPGLVYSNRGAVARTRGREALHDPDALPFPARDLLDIAGYRSAWKKRHGYFSMNLVTTRGCPFHCNWCAKPIYGQAYHSRTPENVCEEMSAMKADYRPDHLWFCDDIFGLKPGWISSFADEVLRRDARIPFKCLSRADLLLRDEAVRHLERAGCRTVWIGAESGSQKILDAMEKGTTIEQIYASTHLLHAAGIRVGFFLQYGYPGETRTDIDMTLQMVKDCNPDEIGVSVSYPLPGTKFYESVKARLGDKRNWVDSEDLALLYPGAYSPDFYRELHRLTHKKFRLWQGIRLLKEAFARRAIPDRTTIRRIASSAYHALTLPRVEARLEEFARTAGSVR